MSKKRRKKSSYNQINTDVNKSKPVENNDHKISKSQKKTEPIAEKSPANKIEPAKTEKIEENKTNKPKEIKAPEKENNLNKEKTSVTSETAKKEINNIPEKNTDEKKISNEKKTEKLQADNTAVKAEKPSGKQEVSKTPEIKGKAAEKADPQIRKKEPPAQTKSAEKKTEPVSQQNGKTKIDDTLEFAIETEPDVIKEKRSIKEVLKTIVSIITAPEDNDLNYGDDGEYDDIFFEEEQPEAVKPDNSPSVQNRKKELPKNLITSSLYKDTEKNLSAKKTTEKKPVEKTSVSEKNTIIQPAQISDTSQSELKEHVPYRSEAEKKNEEKPVQAKKPKKPGSGQEISVNEILKAKNSVPDRSAKAYGSMDTVDKKEREKETEIPIFVNKEKYKNTNPNDNVRKKADFDLNSLSDEKLDPNANAKDVKSELKNEAQEDESKNELSHSEKAPAEKADVNVQRKNELAHSVQDTNKPAEKPDSKKHELSRPETAAAADNTDAARKNELSHDTAAKAESQIKENLLVKAEEKTEDQEKPALKQETAESLPGGDGVKIDPWVPKKKAVKKETAEAKSDVLMYRSSEAVPFIVMAGKFTRTLKNEYDNTRKIRQSLPPEPIKTSSAPQIKEQTANDKNSAEKSPPKKSTAVKSAADAQKAKKAESPEKEKKPPEKSKISDIQKLNKSSKKKKEKNKFKISDIFNYDEDTFDEEEEEEVVKPEIPDYTKEEDGEEIKKDIDDNFRKVFTRMIVLICACAGSIAAAVMAKFFSEVFTTMMKNGWLIYSLIMFFLFLVSVFVSRYPIVNGFMPLRKLKGNSDTPVSIAALAVAVQSIVSLFQADVFLNDTYHLYVPLLILALLLNCMGKLLIIKRTSKNFKFLRRKDARYAGKIYTKMENAERFVSSLPSRKPIIAYSKYSKFMSNFLQLSYAADPVEELSAFFAPISALLSLAGAVAFGIVTKDFVGGISFMAMTSCITIPMCSLLAINIPMLNLASTANKNGAMVVGYEAVKQFCDTNTIMIDSSDLYPKGNIILSGMKTINESKLQEAISAGASMTFAVNGPLTHVFETIVRQSKYKLPEYESISYDDKMGLSGWCNGNRILIGGRAMFKKHNIKLPDESVETKYRKRGNEIVYISVGGELAVMFILTYKVDRAIAQSLRNLEETGVNLVVRTIDPNITEDHIAKKFNLFPRCIKVLPTDLGQICNEELSAKEKTSRAYLVTNGKLSSFANAVAGCIKIKSTVTIAKIVQYMAIIIGFLLVSIISFISGFAKLGSLELLLYIGFWCAALIVVSVAARRIT